MRKMLIMVAATLMLAGCNNADTASEAQVPAVLTLADATIFPADATLARAEDGVILPDGRLIVADQRHGLIELKPDGTLVAFANFPAAGYADDPEGERAGPNGVHLSPDATHILTADVFTGAIYRTDVASGTTEKVYQHSATVNTAIEDSTGAIWFTQSTAGIGEMGMLAAIDRALGDGALLRLAPDGEGGYSATPQVVVEGLNFANGFYIDEAGGRLFLSETMSNRVLAFALDLAKGTVADRRVLAELMSPDNMRRDADGMLWVASPLANRVVIIDPADGTMRVAFNAQSSTQEEVIAEWNRRGEAGEPRLELMGPQISGDLPGLLTGIIMDPQGRAVYLSNLGNALVKLPE